MGFGGACQSWERGGGGVECEMDAVREARSPLSLTELLPAALAVPPQVAGEESSERVVHGDVPQV